MSCDAATARSTVLLPVPGGPSRTTCAPLSSAASRSSISRSRPTGVSGGVIVDHHTADVLAVEQILVALVHFVQRVRPGDDLVQLDVARLVQTENLRDVVGRIAVAEQAADDRLAVQREH